MNTIDTREWLLTNGLGGYASGTVSGPNTRTYHGLLVAGLNPPVDRTVLLAKIEERVLINGQYVDLSTNYYPGTIHPAGYEYLENFQRMPYPSWTYRSEDWKLRKSIQLLEKSNTVILKYENLSNKPLQLELHPLWSCSDYHACFKEDSKFNFYTSIQEKQLTTYPYYNSLPVFTKWNFGEFVEARNWYKNILLPEEERRGLNNVCDYFRIGYIQASLPVKRSLQVMISADKETFDSYKFSKNTFKETQKDTSFYDDLISVAEQFIVHRNSTDSASLIAGYHWFTDWGRDTMIAMRGLTIATGKYEISKSILETFLDSVQDGLLPNRFPDYSKDAVEYNNIDGALWLFQSLYEFYLQFKDASFIARHLPVLNAIITNYSQGTRFNIHVTEEGLLYGGKQGWQLTWMDAKVNGEVITPRIGCPVEVNCLWYNALKIYEFFCELRKTTPGEEISELIKKFEKNFPAYFINKKKTLYDVVIPGKMADNCCRPNQIYALSLPFTVVEKETQQHIFEQIQQQLFTPYGLRTLSPNSGQYQGHYGGNQLQRDRAYHQGTVWPFLLEPYFAAYFKLNGVNTKSKQYVLDQLKPIVDHFYKDAGLNCISEVFDGDNPHSGKGCIQQAWSVAAILKLYIDYKLYEI